jgi:hypothetical protein
MTPPFDRRRAEDVFRTLETDVFPRIISLEAGVKQIANDGCAQRAGDLHRIRKTEENTIRIFDKIEEVAKCLSNHRADVATQIGAVKTEVTKQLGEMNTSVATQIGAVKTEVTKQGGGIMVWVLSGVIVVLVGLLIYFAKDYAHDIEVHVGKQSGKPPAAVTTNR